MKTKHLEGEYEGLKGVPVIREPGSAIRRNTASWRTARPVINRKNCIKCRTCWISCPDAAIRWINNQPEWTYRNCKGCGICANECPVKTIDMKKESDFLE